MPSPKHKHSNLSQSRSGQLYFAIRLESRKSANKRIYLSIYRSSDIGRIESCDFGLEQLAEGGPFFGVPQVVT